MTAQKRIIARVISLMLVAIIITIVLSSLALAARDEKIYPSNVAVGGVSIANLSRQQAIQALEDGAANQWDQNLRLQVKNSGEIISIPLNAVGIHYDLNTTMQNLDRLVASNSSESKSLWKHAVVRGKAMDLRPVLHLDNKDLLYAKLQEIKNKLDQPAVNARVLYKNGYLEYITHKKGLTLDIGDTMTEIDAALAKGYSGPIEIAFAELSPSVKTEDIKTVTDLIGVYMAPLDASSAVKNNLPAYISSLNGAIVMPGDSLSLEKILGDKTGINAALKQIAAAIYQASLNAHLPVNEQTVRGGTFKDIKLTNNLSDPILLYLGIDDNKLMVKIFGCQSEAGREISLSREQTELVPQVIVQTSPELKSQERLVKQAGKNGMRIRTYRVVKENGREVAKELLAEETVPPVNTIIITAPGSSIK